MTTTALFCSWSGHPPSPDHPDVKGRGGRLSRITDARNCEVVLPLMVTSFSVAVTVTPLNQQSDRRGITVAFKGWSPAVTAPRGDPPASMFADVMALRVTLAFVTSTPSPVSLRNLKAFRWCLLLLPGARPRSHRVSQDCRSVSVSGVLFTRILCSPFTGPSIGPSPMASITLIIVDLRLSFASTGVLTATCPLSHPLL